MQSSALIQRHQMTFFRSSFPHLLYSSQHSELPKTSMHCVLSHHQPFFTTVHSHHAPARHPLPSSHRRTPYPISLTGFFPNPSPPFSTFLVFSYEKQLAGASPQTDRHCVGFFVFCKGLGSILKWSCTPCFWECMPSVRQKAKT